MRLREKRPKIYCKCINRNKVNLKIIVFGNIPLRENSNYKWERKKDAEKYFFRFSLFQELFLSTSSKRVSMPPALAEPLICVAHISQNRHNRRCRTFFKLKKGFKWSKWKFKMDFSMKKKSWVKKCLEIMSIKGGEGPTPNGKIHLKFPFWLFEHLPKGKNVTLGQISRVLRPKTMVTKISHKV